jgi:hypothetical protein
MRESQCGYEFRAPGRGAPVRKAWSVTATGTTALLLVLALGGCRSSLEGLGRPDASVDPRHGGDGGQASDPDPGPAAAAPDAGGTLMPASTPVPPAPPPPAPAPVPPPVPTGDSDPPPPDASPSAPDAGAPDAIAGPPAPAAPSTCTLGQVVCVGRMPQICGADGKWVNGAPCAYACQGGCVNRFAAISAGRGAPTDGEGVAEFARNAMTFYSQRGGLFGARGFNVVIVDPASGATLEPVKNFDPWNSPLSGNALKALVSYLDAIEPGRLVMIATCDDAGITKLNSCDKDDSEPVKNAIAALQRLGSTQITDLCFRGAWSFAAITGQGRALAEKVSAGAKISAEVVLPAAP